MTASSERGMRREPSWVCVVQGETADRAGEDGEREVLRHCGYVTSRIGVWLVG